MELLAPASGFSMLVRKLDGAQEGVLLRDCCTGYLEPSNL